MKAKALSILTLIAALFLTLGQARAEQKPASNPDELRRIQEELRGVRKKEVEATKKERSVLSEIEEIDRGLERKRAEVRRLDSRLGGVAGEAAATEAEIKSGKDNLSRKERDLAERLRAMYKTRRSGGIWASAISDGGGSLLKRYKYLSVMSRRDKALLDGYSKGLDEINRRGETLRRQREEYDRLKRQRDKEYAEALSREAAKKTALASIRKQKGSYEAMARELEESSRRMQDLMVRIEKGAVKSKPSLPGVGPLPSLHAGLEWLVVGEVTAKFGRQKHPDYDTYIFKKGIEVQAPVKTEVKAVEQAEVVFANWFKGLGLVVILRHGGDYYSVYAHLADVRVKMGERVGRGQVIATLGDTGGSAGPSLYFEVRKGADALDPLTLLGKRR